MMKKRTFSLAITVCSAAGYHLSVTGTVNDKREENVSWPL